MTFKPSALWRIASYGDTFSRENSGALIIMQGNGDDAVRIGTVDMLVKAKRGEAWKTNDPQQEAIAQFIIDTVNATLKQ